MNAAADKSERQIADTIRAVAERKRHHRSRRQWLRAAACFAIGLLLVIVIDWYAAWQSPWPRWIGPLAVWSLSGWFGWRALRLQLSHPDELAAARALDRSSSNSQERWSTVAALQPGGIGATGSQAMAQALIRETAPLCRFIDPATVEAHVPERRTVTAFSIAGVLLFGFLACYLPQGSPRLLARFALPWAGLPLTRINERTPPPSPQLTGSDIELRANIGGKQPHEVILELGDGRNQSPQEADQRLTTATPKDRDTPATFIVERMRKPLRYRLLAGDAATPWRTLKVTERPKLSAIQVTVTDPSYSTRPPRVWQKSPSDVKAVRGSKVEVELEMDRDISMATVEVAVGARNPRSLPVQKIGPRRYRFRSDLNADLMFRPAFESAEGHANQSLPFCRIAVVEDRPPSVELNDESAREIVSLSQDIKVAFEARDDIGVASAEVVVTITDRDGNQSEKVLPIDLGDQKGRSEVNFSDEIATAELGLSPDDEISYAVRVKDAFQQLSGAGKSELATSDSPDGANKEGEGGSSSEDQMTKRSLKIRKDNQNAATTEKRALRISSRNLLNELEAKKKQLLAIESAFEQLKARTASALKHTRSAKAPGYVRGKPRNLVPLYEAVKVARSDIEIASRAAANFGAKAPGTPYAFISLQLQAIVRGHLQPAEAKLKSAVAGGMSELPPREPHRNMAQGHLTQALAEMTRLDSSVAQVRSQVEAEMAMADLMEMHVAQVEDMPVLMEAGGAGTPYQRSPGEVSKEQAEAALRLLESRKALYKKTAELLEQNPALWQRYMDKSQKESELFRDQLEALALRHRHAQAITSAADDGGNADAELNAVIAIHQQELASSLQRTLKKARIWIPAVSWKDYQPTWIEPLNSALMIALRDSSGEGLNIDAMQSTAQTVKHHLDSVVSQLRRITLTAPAASRGFLALRLAEIEQAQSRQGLTSELISAMRDQDWQRAALLEQTNIAHQTQQLAGRIEVQSAGLLTLSEEVEGYGMALTEIVQSSLMPPLGHSVDFLQRSDAKALVNAADAQEDAAEGFAMSMRALDAFVMAAIREKDRREPAKASAAIAGLPKITASTLQELQDKLSEESEAGESFGIPCCRPTNFQIISDWETFASSPKSASGNKPASSSSSSGGRPSTGSPSGKPGSKPGSGEAGDKPSSTTASKGSSSPGPQAKRSEVDVAGLTGIDPKASTKPGQSSGPPTTEEMAQLARDQSLEQAQSIAEGLARNATMTGSADQQRSANKAPGAAAAQSGNGATAQAGNLEVDGEGGQPTGPSLASGGGLFLSPTDSAQDWNRIGSELRREFLQERSDDLPEHYRDAVEEYFRQLSKWKSRAPKNSADQKP